MDRFIIEKFVDGEMLHDETVESDQRLFNERDLDVICVNKEKALVFVRSATDVSSGYFLNNDGRWDYGTREDCMNVIKRRI